MGKYCAAIYLLVVVCFNSFGQSQNQTIQAIEELHAQETDMYRLVNESNRLLKDSNMNSALTKIQKALEISFEIDNDRGEAFSYHTLGSIQYRKRNYKEAITYFQKAYGLFESLHDQNALYNSLRFLCQSFEANNQYAEAILTYKRYLKMAQAKGNSEGELFAKESLGRVYFNNKQFGLSNAFYQQLLVAYRTANVTEKISETYDNMGKCYAGLQDTTNALKYFELAGTLGDSYTSDDAQLLSWQSVGRSYNSIGEYDKSVEYEKKAKKINKSRNDYKGVLSNNTNIANDYIFMNRADEAIPFLKENIDLSAGVGELKSTGETYKALSDAYAQMGKIDAAKKSFDTYVEVQEQLLSDREKALGALEAENQGFTDKEKQIEFLIRDKELDSEKIDLLQSKQQLETEKANAQKRINYILIGLMALLLVGLGFFYRSSRQKQLANKLLSIRSLRSQMNPHFIFNSLNSVNSFISKSDERSANKYLSEFARLMRTVLEHSKQDFVVLSAEIEVLERYLSLEHIRFKDQFDYTFTVDDAVDTDRIVIAPMLVQPYIENAIWHGLRYNKEKGNLVVTFMPTGNESLKITVQDDGIGRTESKRIKTKNQKQGKSTGLKNTASRLQLLNEVHKVEISCKISDLKSDGTGTIVEIELPYIDVDDKKLVEIE
jgi:tetratricopeptide (TPR) repeat protein